MDKRARVRTIELGKAAMWPVGKGGSAGGDQVVAMTIRPTTSAYPTSRSGYADVHESTLTAVPPLDAFVDVRGRRRTWLSRLMLVHSDLFALLLSYFVAEHLFGSTLGTGGVSPPCGPFVFSLPLLLLPVHAPGVFSPGGQVVPHTTPPRGA